MHILRNSALRANSCVAKPAAPCKPLAINFRVSAAASDAPKTDKKEEKKEKPHLFDPKFSSKEVTMFLKTLVEQTEIVEVDLQVGSFELKVKRSTAGTSPALSAAAPAAAAATAPVTVSSPAPSSPAAAPLESVDESVIKVVSTKVGIFRRGKYAAGKRVGNGNAVNEGDQVKRGSSLGFIEQLGTYFALESPQAGEVLKFRLKDGDPVGYHQSVVDLAPFFGGV